MIGFDSMNAMGSMDKKKDQKSRLASSMLNSPRFKNADVGKWVDGTSYKNIIAGLEVSSTGSKEISDTFYVQVSGKYIKSNYASQGFRDGDLLLLEPLEKIKYFDRMLVKVDKKGIWICQAQKLPGKAIRDLYEKSANKANTLLIEEEPLSFIAEGEMFIGNDKTIPQNIECFHILGMYRGFETT